MLCQFYCFPCWFLAVWPRFAHSCRVHVMRILALACGGVICTSEEGSKFGYASAAYLSVHHAAFRPFAAPFDCGTFACFTRSRAAASSMVKALSSAKHCSCSARIRG